MSVIQDIDMRVTHTKKRVIYFQAEDRNIIKKALDSSESVWGRLTNPNYNRTAGELKRDTQKGKRYSYLHTAELIADFSEVYNIYMRQYKAYDKKACVFTITDFHVYNESLRSLMVKAFLDCGLGERAYLFISTPHLLIPDGFGDEIELIQLKEIDSKEIADIIKRNLSRKVLSSVDDNRLMAIANSFKGLNEYQVEDILRAVENEFGIKSELEAPSEGLAAKSEKARLSWIRAVKETSTQKDPTIEIEFPDKFEEKAVGLEGYNKWLENNKFNFLNPEQSFIKHGCNAPKGVLLTGVPGTGKTMMARKTANEFNKATLVKFKIERVLSKDFGASESNFIRCINRIETLAPCVMLIDEIEKAFRMDDNVHEVKLAILGQLLDWMQKRKALVFTFITANSIKHLPPELLRDGRLSERFFVYMPMHDELVKILTQKLLDIDEQTEKTLFSEKLRERIVSGQTAQYVVHEIGISAKTENRFFTGANLTKLVDAANNGLRVKNNTAPYGWQAYEEALVLCARKMVPQGMSNMDDIISMWFEAKKNQYINVSDTELVPFGAFDEESGKFNTGRMSAFNNDYDRHMYAAISKRIEARQDEINRKRKLEEKYISET